MKVSQLIQPKKILLLIIFLIIAAFVINYFFSGFKIYDLGYGNEQFSISPDNKWLIYVRKYDSSELGIVNLISKEKFDLDGVGGGIAVASGCWTYDSQYCLSYMFTDYPPVFLDFTSGIPKTVNQVNGDITYDITYKDLHAPDKIFTCSDCHQPKQPYSANSTHGETQLSSDGRYQAITVSRGDGWYTPPDLYVLDMRTKIKKKVASNVYNYHWTSDSKRLYFYKCEFGGGCGSLPKDRIYYIELK